MLFSPGFFPQEKGCLPQQKRSAEKGLFLFLGFLSQKKSYFPGFCRSKKLFGTLSKESSELIQLKKNTLVHWLGTKRGRVVTKTKADELLDHLQLGFGATKLVVVISPIVLAAY
ncbi:MAG: hypothetical protein HZB67_01645, partial [Candidatus Aenigmarchaeota archaeon]|nr:hypothetical protein [Candidatus Aenigmarchaeota archaeon]